MERNTRITRNFGMKRLEVPGYPLQKTFTVFDMILANSRDKTDLLELACCKINHKLEIILPEYEIRTNVIHPGSLIGRYAPHEAISILFNAADGDVLIGFDLVVKLCLLIEHAKVAFKVWDTMLLFNRDLNSVCENLKIDNPHIGTALGNVGAIISILEHALGVKSRSI